MKKKTRVALDITLAVSCIGLLAIDDCYRGQPKAGASEAIVEAVEALEIDWDNCGPDGKPMTYTNDLAREAAAHVQYYTDEFHTRDEIDHLMAGG